MKRKYLETVETILYSVKEVEDSTFNQNIIEVDYEIPTNYMYKESMNDKDDFKGALEEIRLLEEQGDDFDDWLDYIITEEEYNDPCNNDSDGYLQTMEVYTYKLVNENTSNNLINELVKNIKELIKAQLPLHVNIRGTEIDANVELTRIKGEIIKQLGEE